MRRLREKLEDDPSRPASCSRPSGASATGCAHEPSPRTRCARRVAARLSCGCCRPCGSARALACLRFACRWRRARVGLVMFGMHDHAKFCRGRDRVGACRARGRGCCWRAGSCGRSSSLRAASARLAARRPQRPRLRVRAARAARARRVVQRDGHEPRAALRRAPRSSSPGRATTCARRSRRCGAMVEALEDGLAEPDEYLPAIREQLRDCSRGSSRISSSSRGSTPASLTLELRDASLGDLVASCLRALDAEARARNVRLEARARPVRPAVRIAPDKVERVLLNLLDERAPAHAARRRGRRLVEPDADHVVVAVEDTGDGLAPGAPQRMFERFWRDDDSRTRSSGGAGPRPGDRAGARARPRRHDLGREPRQRRRPRRLHAAAGEDARGLDVEPLVLEIEVPLHPAHDVVVDAAFRPELAAPGARPRAARGATSGS